MDKWWDTKILDRYDAATEDWLSIAQRLPPLRTEDGSPPTREQLRFWYHQLQPKQQWAYSVYRETAEAFDNLPSIPASSIEA